MILQSPFTGQLTVIPTQVASKVEDVQFTMHFPSFGQVIREELHSLWSSHVNVRVSSFHMVAVLELMSFGS